MTPPAKRPAYLVRVGMAHRRLVISVLIGVATMLALPAAPITRILIGWDLGVVIYLVWAAVVMSQCTSVAQMKANAAAQDEGALAILILVAASGMASLIAIFAELAALERTDPHYGIYVVLAIGTVVLSWTFIHTIFALHYAHEFYGSGEHKNGLRFPGDGQPDYWDFIYFSFVVGMTFQVSDVQVLHKTARRTVVAHGALSFFFTTAVVAMAVNIAASILQK
ncbi:MAG: hypothetical protein QOF09_4837 [Alphaproteobacteria bacterium]|jgi:uncharacterized membrane protein|nr:hypothetical protein [Alphaproteobacteria bacterium]